MRNRTGELDLSAAYPVSRKTITGLPLDAADAELLATILAESQGAPASRESSASAPAGSTWTARRARRYVGLATTAAAAAAALLVVFGTGGSGPGPDPAYAAELARLAKISPHILLGGSGWHPVVTEIAQNTEGGTEFWRGDLDATEEPGPQNVAKFRWRDGSVAEVADELAAHGATVAASAPVLNSPGQIFTYPHAGKKVFEAVILWKRSGRAFEFRTSVTSLLDFERRVADLDAVGEREWQAAIKQLLQASLWGGSLFACYLELPGGGMRHVKAPDSQQEISAGEVCRVGR